MSEATLIPLNLVLVEDSSLDAEEILYALRCGGFEPFCLRVETSRELEKALTEVKWDLVISDHYLPGFSSTEALEIVKQSGFDIPFFIVSGVVDEETAIMAMRSGASDFFKKDRLARLAPAVKRELVELQNRKQRDAAQKSLTESEERFRLMVETALDYAIFLLDANGFVETWNVGAERIFGYTPEEAVGLPLYKLFPDNGGHCGETPERSLELSALRGSFEEEALRRRKDGSLFLAQSTMIALRNPDGSLRGYSRITRDIDEKRRTAEALESARSEADNQALMRQRAELEKAEVDVERRNLRSLFHHTSALVAITRGSEYIYEFSNPAHTNFIGFDCIGLSMRDIGTLSPDILHLAESVYSTGNHGQIKNLVANVNGESHFFDFVLSARRNGQGAIDGIMVLATNVTEQLLARKAAEASSEAKSTFLANMSHEIRTPLGAILGFSSLMQDDALSCEDRHQYIETINRNGQALTRIIDDILDLAKVEAGQLDLEEITFSLRDLLNEVVELFAEKAAQKRIYIRLIISQTLPELLRSDPTRLRQILFNIVGNAIKFTNVGGIEIHVSMLQSFEGALRILVDVKDTGCGLSETQRTRLFQPFTQADNTTTRHFGGTGLGLALSRRLCEALGGSISISGSEVNKGSVFSITFVASLPHGAVADKLAQRRTELPGLEDLRLQNVSILVVDDARDNQLLISRYLTKIGAMVELASDGSEAVNKAMASTHDIILMDIQMPGMDGYQALRALRNLGYRKPIIALTAHALLEERVKTREAGFTTHLTKPLNPEELYQAVLAETQHFQKAQGPDALLH